MVEHLFAETRSVLNGVIKSRESGFTGGNVFQQPGVDTVHIPFLVVTIQYTLVFAHKYRRMGIGWRLFVQQGKPVIADIIPGNALRMADEKIPVAAAEKDNILILG